METMKRINIICPDNGAGLSIDRMILRDHLTSKYEVYFNAMPVNGSRVDMNIFCEVLRPEMLPMARKNVLLPNPEWFFPEWKKFRQQIDMVFCKTGDCQRIFKDLGYNTTFTGFTSQDRHMADVPRQRQFAHFAGKSEHKGTQYIIEAARTFKLPHITIFISPHMNDRFIKKPHVSDDRITFIQTRLSDEQFWNAQNQFQFHLCPSRYEGFGHYINEARSVGAVIITTNAAPMNEVAQASYAYGCAVKQYSRFGEAMLASPDIKSLAEMIQVVSELDEFHIKYFSDKAREAFKFDATTFRKRLLTAVEEILQ